MKDLPPLEGLSSEEKDALIRELWSRVQALEAAVEGRTGKGIKKTSRNSSLPPAKGFKPNSEPAKPSPSERTASVGRAGGGRELSTSPDQVMVAQVNRCPHCDSEVNRASQQLKAVYERFELPPIQPQVIRVERYGGQCLCCQQSYEAPVPVGLEPGSPFGQSIASVVTYLRYGHAVSYQRLSQLMGELYGVTIFPRGDCESAPAGSNPTGSPSSSDCRATTECPSGVQRWNQCPAQRPESVGVGVPE